MNASGFEERKIRLDISRYAPPRYRGPDGVATAAGEGRERLSRGMSDGDAEPAAAQAAPPPAAARKPAPPAPAALHMLGAATLPKFPLSMTARLAGAMGIVAVLAAVSVTVLQSKAERSASAAAADSRRPAQSAVRASDMPKPVRTVTLRPETPMAGAARASAAGGNASVTERIDAVDADPAAALGGGALALKAPLKLWAMFPGEPPAVKEDTAMAVAKTGVPEKTGKDSATDTRALAAQRRAARLQRAKAANEARRRRYARRRARALAAKQQPRRPAETAQAQTATDKPAKKLPLQAAIDSIFGDASAGSSAAGDGGASGGAAPAPAPTGAAFQ